ncbi:glycosyltransferase [Paenibacillaceae bacterium]|nr:glycosyltransferase [Paenibacillaceae bacterium]
MLKAKQFLNDGKMIYPPGSYPADPMISIIMPTYCRGSNGYLRRAIESVLKQSFKNYELIIVDDGSTDGTAGVIAEMQALDSRILHIRHETNCGLPALRINEGLDIARGKYIAYQFDDCQWLPDALQHLHTAIIAAGKPCLVYGKCLFQTGDSEQVLGKRFDYAELTQGNQLAGNSVLHPRSFVEELGGYDYHIVMKRLNDWDLWQRWNKRYPFIFVDQLIARIDSGTEHSLASTSPYDLTGVRVMLDLTNRMNRLLPPNWAEGYLDDLSPVKRAYSPELVDELWRLHLAPWYEQHAPQLLDQPEYGQHTEKTANSLLVTKMGFDPSVDITILNFLSVPDSNVEACFIPSNQLTPDDLKLADVNIFHRSFYRSTNELQEKSLEFNRPVMYMMDDDLLGLHELGPEFSCFAPGEPFQKELVQHIATADMVAVYSPVVADAVRSINPRVKDLRTNILAKYIERHPEPRRPKGPFRICFAGTDARKQEFQKLFPALVQFSAEMGDQLEIHFWGFAPEGLPALRCPVFYEPQSLSYTEYILRLRGAQFDVMLSPLDDSSRAKKGKCPIKYLEITAARSIGIYSYAHPYALIEHNLHGIKASNTPEAWLEALRYAWKLGPEGREQIFQAARKDILAEYTTEAQSSSFQTIVETTMLHAMLREKRKENGVPDYALIINAGGDDAAARKLLRSAATLKGYGFQPKVSLLGEEKLHHAPDYKHFAASHGLEMVSHTDNASLDSWLGSHNFSWIHAANFDPDLSALSQRRSIPAMLGMPFAENAHSSETAEFLSPQQLHYIVKSYRQLVSQWWHTRTIAVEEVELSPPAPEQPPAEPPSVNNDTAAAPLIARKHHEAGKLPKIKKRRKLKLARRRKKLTSKQKRAKLKRRKLGKAALLRRYRKGRKPLKGARGKSKLKRAYATKRGTRKIKKASAKSKRSTKALRRKKRAA